MTERDTTFRPNWLAISVVSLVLIAGFVVANAGRSNSSPAISPDRNNVSIQRGDGSTVVFQVEVADDPEEQALGLMHRPNLPDLTGMIFLYDEPIATAFWMKNTLIPLDMVWIDADWRISGITMNTRPLSLTLRPSPGPVSAVLEIAGGTSETLSLRIGDRVEFHPQKTGEDDAR